MVVPKSALSGGNQTNYWEQNSAPAPRFRRRLASFSARSSGICTNRLTISRQEVEERVLVALRDKLMRRDLFEDFCREYVRELNRFARGAAGLLPLERDEDAIVTAGRDGVDFVGSAAAASGRKPCTCQLRGASRGLPAALCVLPVRVR
jgi:hypothetical protein